MTIKPKIITSKYCSDCDFYENPINILYGGNWRICGKRNTIKGESRACHVFENSIVSNMTIKIEIKKRPQLVKRK